MARLLESAWPELESRLRTGPLLAGFDFDGTLAPIAPRPADAQLSPSVRADLQTLAARPATAVAVVSGRALPDLAEKIGLDNVWLAGNHGLEARGPSWTFQESEVQPLLDRVAQLARALDEAVGYIPGVVLEDKRLSLSVHYRLVDSPLVGIVKQRVEAVVLGVPGFRCRQGHKVHEVRPEVKANKGTILTQIRERLSFAGDQMLYVGDDQTDEDAFAACPQGWTIKVGPLESVTEARFLVETPGEVAALVRRLVELRA